MNYKVTTQYARGEEELIAEFCASQDATIFLTKKISTDQQQTKKKIYRLYGDSELSVSYTHLTLPTNREV